MNSPVTNQLRGWGAWDIWYQLPTLQISASGDYEPEFELLIDNNPWWNAWGNVLLMILICVDLHLSLHWTIMPRQVVTTYKLFPVTTQHFHVKIVLMVNFLRCLTIVGGSHNHSIINSRRVGAEIPIILVAVNNYWKPKINYCETNLLGTVASNVGAHTSKPGKPKIGVWLKLLRL